jgi:hypothetical protein
VFWVNSSIFIFFRRIKKKIFTFFFRENSFQKINRLLLFHREYLKNVTKARAPYIQRKAQKAAKLEEKKLRKELKKKSRGVKRSRLNEDEDAGDGENGDVSDSSSEDEDEESDDDDDDDDELGNVLDAGLLVLQMTDQVIATLLLRGDNEVFLLLFVSC